MTQSVTVSQSGYSQSESGHEGGREKNFVRTTSWLTKLITNRLTYKASQLSGAFVPHPVPIYVLSGDNKTMVSSWVLSRLAVLP